MGKITALALALLAASALPASAQQSAAAPAGEIAPAHCTLTKAMLCKESGCTPSDSFGELKLPTKISVDFVRKVLLGVGSDGFATASSLDSLAVTNNQLATFGVDQGWSFMAHASATDPSITIAVSSHHTVLNAFGSCVAAN